MDKAEGARAGGDGMKLLDLVAAQEALQRLILLELPAATSFKIARTVRPIQAELRGYEQARVALVRRLGEEKDGQITVSPDKFAEFNTELGALLEVDIEIEINVLSPSILTDDTCPECGVKIKSGMTVKPSDLMALWFLFEEEK